MATILIAEDDASIRTVLAQALKRAGHTVEMSSTLAGIHALINQGMGDVLITDVTLPDGNALDSLAGIRKKRPNLPVVVMSANNTFLTAVRASEQGAFEYLPKPFDLNVLIEVVNKSLSLKSLEDTHQSVVEAAENMPLIGRSTAMQEVYRIIARLTQTEISVMIMGESGTGKERVARALHDYGRRKTGPFIAINMAAIPKDLIESELFGHERGAFTGAQARQIGRFEQAQGGTLFLDEIGDMPVEAQTRLLRVLQEGEYTSVGGRTAQKTDVRIVAASNKDLLKLVGQGAFREDLYYRLNVVPIMLPPLRERKDDIGDLVAHFIKLFEEQGLPRKHFELPSIIRMMDYDWPGNVRELENFVRRVGVLYPQDVITPEVITQELFAIAKPNAITNIAGTFEDIINSTIAQLPSGVESATLYDDLLPMFERPLLTSVLRFTHGNQIKASDILGINRNTLRKRILLLDLDVGSIKESD